MTASQRRAWEEEYNTQRLVSAGYEPSQEVKNFTRFLRREAHLDLSTLSVLDLGCGVGKHSLFFASLGARVVGFDIAENAIAEATRRARDASLSVTFEVRTMGEPYPLENESVDVVLDIMSSNSLTERERRTYLAETNRVLKPGGWMLVRALCKDGDRNAKFLLEHHPWKEPDTYVMPKSNFHERVFSESDITTLYGAFFTIRTKKKSSHYTRFDGRLYKRNYWVLYLKKPASS